jgi:hypothetical protein
MDTIKTENNLQKETFWKSKFNIKNCLRICALLLVIWLIVSGYYYSQHSYAVKTFTIDKQIKVGDSFFYINKAKLQNISNINRNLNLSDWQIAIAEVIPRPLFYPYLKVCSFYSSPYEFNNDVGTLKISGLIYSAQDFSGTEKPIEIVSDSGAKLSNGYQESHQSDSNLYLVEIRAEDKIPLDLSTFNIRINDIEKGETQEIQVQPSWETKKYSFFKLEPPNDLAFPSGFMQQFIESQTSKDKNSLDYVHSEVRDTFSLSKVNNTNKPFQVSDTKYEGKHNNFDNAFSVNVKFGTEKQDKFIVETEQKFYLVVDKGNWWIIDVDSSSKI